MKGLNGFQKTVCFSLGLLALDRIICNILEAHTYSSLLDYKATKHMIQSGVETPAAVVDAVK